MKKVFLLAIIVFSAFATMSQDLDSIEFRKTTEGKILKIDSLLNKLIDCLIFKKVDGISRLETDSLKRKFQTFHPNFSCKDKFFSLSTTRDSLDKKNYKVISFKDVLYTLEETEGFLIETSIRPRRINYSGMREVSYSFIFSRNCLGKDIVAKNNFDDWMFLKELSNLEIFLVEEIEICNNLH